MTFVFKMHVAFPCDSAVYAHGICGWKMRIVVVLGTVAGDKTLFLCTSTRERVF